MSANKGGPAFPLPLGTANLSEPSQSGGMTLRDYFAANCPDSEVFIPTWAVIRKFKGLPDSSPIEQWKDKWSLEYRCHQRYAYADAMLEARES